MPRREHQHITADDMRVLSLPEWRKLNGISATTSKRLFAAGNGPRTIQLSPRRIGVRVIDNAKWHEERLRD